MGLAEHAAALLDLQQPLFEPEVGELRGAAQRREQGVRGPEPLEAPAGVVDETRDGPRIRSPS
jgi:hypothetical protein